mmetsp:Transcript_22046/g.61340  ORF Transcript_22046/g.61340 Transcript_22046/m.61340 type:complete len:241 (+) Transcript_22046:54-776(+)
MECDVWRGSMLVVRYGTLIRVVYSICAVLWLPWEGASRWMTSDWVLCCSSCIDVKVAQTSALKKWRSSWYLRHQTHVAPVSLGELRQIRLECLGRFGLEFIPADRAVAVLVCPLEDALNLLFPKFETKLAQRHAELGFVDAAAVVGVGQVEQRSHGGRARRGLVRVDEGTDGLRVVSDDLAAQLDDGVVTDDPLGESHDGGEDAARVLSAAGLLFGGWLGDFGWLRGCDCCLHWGCLLCL